MFFALKTDESKITYVSKFMKSKSLLKRILSWIMIFVMVVAQVSVPVEASDYESSQVDSNSAYFQKFLSPEQEYPVYMYGGYNFTEMFTVNMVQNAQTWVGNRIGLNISRDRYAQEMEVRAEYVPDKDVMNAIQSESVSAAFTLYMRSWKTYVSTLNSNSAVVYAELAAYTSTGWVTLKNYKMDRDKEGIVGLDGEGKLTWVKVPADTQKLGVRFHTGGSEDVPNGEYKNIMIYLKDDKAPMPVKATGNSYRGIGDEAYIDVHFDEYVYTDEAIRSELKIDVQASKYPTSTEVDTYEFTYESENPNQKYIRFKYEVPDNEKLDSHSFKIKGTSLNELAKNVKDWYGNTMTADFMEPEEYKNVEYNAPLYIDNKSPYIYNVAIYSEKLETGGADARYLKAGDKVTFGVVMNEQVSNTAGELEINNETTLHGRNVTDKDSPEYKRFSAGVANLKDNYSIYGFDYTIKEGDDIERLDVVHKNGLLEVNLGTVKDLSRNTMDNTDVGQHQGAEFMTSDNMIDTVAPTITFTQESTVDENISGDGGNLFTFRVEVKDDKNTSHNSGVDHYTVSGPEGMTYFVSQGQDIDQVARMNNGELQATDKFNNAEKLPGDVAHYLYLKAPDSKATDVVVTAYDKAGNKVTAQKNLTFDTTAPVIDITHTASRTDLQTDVNIQYIVNVDDGIGSGVDTEKIRYKLLAPGDNPLTDGEEKTVSPENFENGQFIVEDIALHGDVGYNKILYVKAYDKNNNFVAYNAENSYPLSLSTKFNIEIADSTTSGAIASEHDIKISNNTTNSVRIAWVKGDAEPTNFDETFYNHDGSTTPAAISIANSTAQTKFGDPFSGKYKLWIQWFDRSTNSWLDYSVPKTYRFSNQAPTATLGMAKENVEKLSYFRNIPTVRATAYESEDMLFINPENSYIQVENAIGTIIGKMYWPNNTTTFEFDPNSIEGVRENLESGVYTVELYAESYGGQSTTDSISFNIDRDPPKVSVTKVDYTVGVGDRDNDGYDDDIVVTSTGQTETVMPEGLHEIFITESDLKPAIHTGVGAIDTTNYLEMYTHWIKLADNVFDENNSGMKVYYIVDDPEYDFLKVDPNTGMVVPNVDGAINLNDYKDGDNDITTAQPDSKTRNIMPKEKTLYLRDAAWWFYPEDSYNGPQVDSSKDPAKDAGREYFADAMYAGEFPNDVKGEGVFYAPISIPVPYVVNPITNVRDLKSGDINVKMLVVDARGNYSVHETIFRFDIDAPTIEATYSTTESGTGSVIARFTATDNQTAAEDLEYAISVAPPKDGDYIDYTGEPVKVEIDEAKLLEYVKQTVAAGGTPNSAMNTKIYFRDSMGNVADSLAGSETGNEVDSLINPNLFVIDRPNVHVEWVNDDYSESYANKAYASEYTLNADWQTNKQGLPYVADDRMKSVDENGFVTFKVSAYDNKEVELYEYLNPTTGMNESLTAEEAEALGLDLSDLIPIIGATVEEDRPLRIAFANDMIYSYEEDWMPSSNPFGANSENLQWTIIEDGIDLPWLKVEKIEIPKPMRPNDYMSTYTVTVLVPPTTTGINQILIQSDGDYGTSTVGTANTWEMQNAHPISNADDYLLLVKSGTDTLEAPTVTKTEKKLGTPEAYAKEVISVDVSLEFNAPVFASKNQNDTIPTDVESYKKVHGGFNFTEDGEHIIYYFDVYGNQYEANITITEISDTAFPKVKFSVGDSETELGKNEFTNKASIKVTLDSQEMSTTYFYGVKDPNNKAVTLDGTQEIVNSKNVYELASFYATQNGTYTYTVHRADGAEYQGTITISSFDKTPPTAEISYEEIYQTLDGKDVKTAVVATLTDIQDTGSGVGSIKYMTYMGEDEDGNKIYADAGVSSYRFLRDGEYIFVLQDGAGNITEIKATATGIDTTIIDDTNPPTFRVEYFGENAKGEVLNIGTVFTTDENGVVPGPIVATEEYVLVNLVPFDETDVKITFDSGTPNGVEVLDRSTNTKFKFYKDVEISLILTDSNNNKTKITLAPGGRIGAGVDGAIRYEMLDEDDNNIGDKVRATLIVEQGSPIHGDLAIDQAGITGTDAEGYVYKDFTENTTFTFKVTNEWGTSTEFVANVDMFDATAPKLIADSITYAPYKPAASSTKINRDVVTTLEFDEAIKSTKAYSANDVELNTDALSALGVRIIPDGELVHVIATKNIDIQLSVADDFGNYSLKSPVKVDWIDKDAPKVKLAEVKYNEPEAGYATVVITQDANETDALIVPAADNPNGDNGKFEIVFDKDGSYPITVYDPTGNSTIVVAKVEGLTKLRERVEVDVEVSPTEVVKGDVTVKFTPTNKDAYVYGEIKTADGQISVGKIDIPQGKIHTVKINENGVYNFNFFDSYNQATTVTVNITNIDNIAPTIDFIGRIEQTLFIGDDEALETALNAFTVSDNVDKLTTADVTKEITDPQGNIVQNIVTSEPGEYNVKYTARDKVGNTTSTVRKIIFAEKGNFDILITESENNYVRVVADGQRLIVNSKVIAVDFSNPDDPKIPITAEYKAGLLNTAQMKSGTKPIENGKMTVSNSGWYTIMFQDALLRRQVLHLYVSVGDEE